MQKAAKPQEYIKENELHELHFSHQDRQDCLTNLHRKTKAELEQLIQIKTFPYFQRLVRREEAHKREQVD